MSGSFSCRYLAMNGESAAEWQVAMRVALQAPAPVASYGLELLVFGGYGSTSTRLPRHSSNRFCVDSESTGLAWETPIQRVANIGALIGAGHGTFAGR
jgi:hypothetical protein